MGAWGQAGSPALMGGALLPGSSMLHHVQYGVLCILGGQ